MTFDGLPYLTTFARAAELGSFTAAARALGLTQAAVSQRIQALEADVGVSLFQRQAGGVRLTDAGRRLHHHAERLLALAAEARADVSGRPDPVHAELTLAASSVPGEHLLPDLLAAFRRKHPHVDVRAAVADSDDVLARVASGRAHLGLVGKKSDKQSLQYRCFACDTLALVVPPSHRWSGRKRVALRDLASEPLLLREPGSGSRWCLEHALARAGTSLVEFRVALELGSNEALKEAVERGLGVAVLSTHVVRKDVAAGRLAALAVSGLALKRPMFAVWDERRPLPIPARLFLDLLEPCRGVDALP